MRPAAASVGFVVLLALLPRDHAADCPTSVAQRVDCGYSGITSSQCEAKGCCWSPVDDDNGAAPWCFFTATQYDLTDVVPSPNGIKGTLSLVSGSAAHGADVETLQLQVLFEAEDYVRVRITDPSTKRWEVPYDVVPRPAPGSTFAVSNGYSVSYTASPFSLTVTRDSDSANVFTMSNLMFEDQFIQFTAAADGVVGTWGLGESTRSEERIPTGQTRTLWARDSAAAGFDNNLYGSHPMYVQVTDSGAAHGGLLMSSNGMDVTLGSDNEVTFRVIGGMIDAYVMMGTDVNSVVQQYTSIVGRPAMPPFWSLGLHNCKYGYTSVYQVEAVVANYSAAGIPLDVQWMDIDYMNQYRDYSYDPTNFPQAEVASFVDTLTSNNQRFVPIVDPGISVDPDAGYAPYDQGVAQDLFVKDLTGAPYLSQVWPGPTYFPDWFNPATADWWKDQLQLFHEQAAFSGQWTDMNEPSNFCNVDGTAQTCVNPGNCPGAVQTDCCLACSNVDPGNTLDYPPYRIGNGYGLVGTKTMAMSAVHYGNVTHYDAHNLFGMMEAMATNAALADVTGERPFILSRSTFAGQGRVSFHWTGDNAATWNDLAASINTILDFQLFGMPMVGADICGFLDDTTEELCARWALLGSLTPFTRNHNTLGAAPQEFYLWESVTEAARYALGAKYAMLPYLYTHFYHAFNDGCLVMRGLWMEFSSDANVIDNHSQFLFGAGVLVSPVITQGATTVDAYFPKGLWYEYGSGALAVDASSGGRYATLDAPLTFIPLHHRGGYIVPAYSGAPMTTVEARSLPMKLLVPLCSQSMAAGDLFLDDGVGVDPLAEFTYVQFNAPGDGTLSASVVQDGYAGAATTVLDDVVVMGSGAVSAVALNGRAWDAWTYDADSGVLTVTGLGLAANAEWSLQWS